jgi:hypothetical protein
MKSNLKARITELEQKIATGAEAETFRRFVRRITTTQAAMGTTVAPDRETFIKALSWNEPATKITNVLVDTFLLLWTSR